MSIMLVDDVDDVEGRRSTRLLFGGSTRGGVFVESDDRIDPALNERAKPGGSRFVGGGLE